MSSPLQPSVPGAPGRQSHSRLYMFLVGLSVCLLLLLIYRTYIFFHTGYSGYINTVLVYGFLLVSAMAFLPSQRRVLKVNVLSVILILFGAETYLRISGKGYPNYSERNSASLFAPHVTPNYDYSRTTYIPQLWVEAPNTNYMFGVEEYRYEHRINSLGLRERESGVFRGQRPLLVLGDSFTFGIGAPADSTGVASLEKNLGLLGKQVLCYNGGSSGSDICFQYKLYEKELRALHPSVVMLNLNESDVYDIKHRGGDERFTADGLQFKGGHWYQFPYSWSYLFRVLVRGVFKLEAESETTVNDQFFQSLKVIRDKVQDFQELSRRDSFQLVVVFTPLEYELRNGQLTLDAVRSELQARHPDIFVMDFLGYFLHRHTITTENVAEYYYRTDLHLKPKGYWLWGEVLADTLVSRGIIP